MGILKSVPTRFSTQGHQVMAEYHEIIMAAWTAKNNMVKVTTEGYSVQPSLGEWPESMVENSFDFAVPNGAALTKSGLEMLLLTTDVFSGGTIVVTE